MSVGIISQVSRYQGSMLVRNEYTSVYYPLLSSFSTLFCHICCSSLFSRSSLRYSLLFSDLRHVPARWKRVSSSVHRLCGSAMMSHKNSPEKSANAGRFLKEGSLLAEEADYASKTGDFTKLVYHHSILSVTMRAEKTTTMQPMKTTPTMKRKRK